MMIIKFNRVIWHKTFGNQEQANDTCILEARECQNDNNADGVRGRGYEGIMSQSRGGHACRRWDDRSELPATGNLQKSIWVGYTENYCRNPDYDSGGVWCYTNDPVAWWQYCDVPDCPDDVDECELGTHTCHEDATCTNTDGSFTCECNSPFTGDGFDCIACPSQECWNYNATTYECSMKPRVNKFFKVFTIFPGWIIRLFA